MGTLPLVVSPTIQNYRVTKMLVDGGSGLNLLTVKILRTLQIPSSCLMPMGVFQGVSGYITQPLGKITLPFTFGDRDNFRTEDIVFDVADTPLPYNGILGRPALAKFMVASHYAYNTLKMPGAWGIIRVKANYIDAVYYVEQLNHDVAVAVCEDANNEACKVDLSAGCSSQPGGSALIPSKKKMFWEDPQITKKVALNSDETRSTTIGARLPIK